MLERRLKEIDQASLGLTVSYTDDERDYLYNRVLETRTKIADIFAAVGIGFDALLLMLHDAFPRETALWYICRYAYFLAILWGIALFGTKSSIFKQRWLALGCGLTSVLCSWIIVDLLTNKSAEYPIHIGFMLSYAVVVGAFVIVMAFVSRPLLLMVTMVSLVFSWILPDLVEGAPNRYVACALIMFMPILNHALHLRMLKAEEREMRVRLSTMPRRMALNLSNDVQTPRERFSICLSSDWRGYQELVSGLADEKVVALLEDYYQRIQEVLTRELTGYDFYMDWIADELFAVIYSGQTDLVDIDARQKMAVRVVETAQKILDMKDHFAYDHKLELSIDIGLSSGHSLIGVIGPTNNRKATALGSNPGRARRLQSTGKLLRTEISEEDRIIFGDEYLIVLSAPNDIRVPINRFDVSDRKLRNLDDKFLYYSTHQSKASGFQYLTSLEALKHQTTNVA